MTRYVGIDPSTKTGFVELSEDGQTAVQQEEIRLINGIYSSDKELLEYGHKIVSRIPQGAVAGIEGFSFGSKGKGVSTQYAVGYSIRFALVAAGIEYIEFKPSQVKKFATGKGNTTKDNMTLPIYRLWGFEHKSDNVRDAYVLAQMAKALKETEGKFKLEDYYQYQLEVLQAVRKAN